MHAADPASLTPATRSAREADVTHPEVLPPSPPTPIPLTAATEPPRQLLALVCDRVHASTSKARYATVITDFWTWWLRLQTPRPPFGKALVLAYRAHRAGLAPRTLNVDLAVLRAFADEAADAGLLARDEAAAIRTIRGVPVRGKRLGRWLSEAQTHAVVAAPDASTLVGLRDRAVIASLFNGGLRRAELVSLDVPQLRRVALLDAQGAPGQRWVLADIVGKGARVRSVPIQDLVAVWLREWLTAAAISDGPVFRGFHKGGRLRATRLSDRGIYDIVTRYARALGIPFAPHDARRTMGEIARRRGGDLKQIQVVYGHSSLTTTERYLNVDLELVDAVTDRVSLVPSDVSAAPAD